MSTQCMVIVNGYLEGKFDSKRGRFCISFEVVPNAGDTVLLEPGPTWGKIWCVIERRYVGSNFVYLGARIATDEDQAIAWKNYGMQFDNI